MNPLKYSPGQIAKSLIAVLTGVIGLCGLAAAELADGPLSTAGGWVVGVALFMTPILVFLKRAEPFIDLLDGPAERES